MNDTTKPKGATRYAETAFGIIPRSKLIELEAEGVAKGLVWVIQNAPKKPQITAQLLLDLHKRCFGFIFPNWAGKLRHISVQVSDYTPPAPHTLREHLINFERDLAKQLDELPNETIKQREQLLRVAAWMQHRIVWIHPFVDYNGRIARLMTNLLLLEYEFPLVEIPAEKSGTIRRRYVAAMQKADRGDLVPLEHLLQQALRNQ